MRFDIEALAPFRPEPGLLTDIDAVRTALIAAARARSPLTYSQLLGELGHGFTRPKMRTICQTLAVVDRAAAANSEPGLAVLVVRQADRLPGQGWWSSQQTLAPEWDPNWRSTAPSYVADLQQQAFDYWSRREDVRLVQADHASGA